MTWTTRTTRLHHRAGRRGTRVQQAFLRSLDAADTVRPQAVRGRAAPLQPPPARLCRPDQELFDQGHTLAAALRILDLEDDLAAERALTARLHERLAARTCPRADPGQRCPATHQRPGGYAASGSVPQGPGGHRSVLSAGQLGLQLAGLLCNCRTPADAGQVQPVGGQCADLLEPADVPAGVPAGAARAARRVQQPLPLVDPQRLRVQPRPAPRPPRC